MTDDETRELTKHQKAATSLCKDLDAFMESEAETLTLVDKALIRDTIGLLHGFATGATMGVERIYSNLMEVVSNFEKNSHNLVTKKDAEISAELLLGSLQCAARLRLSVGGHPIGHQSMKQMR